MIPGPVGDNENPVMYDDAGRPIILDFSLWDGGGSAYDDLGGSDSGICQAGAHPMTCSNPLPSNVGCGAVEVCDNGTDDNCDGQVDEDCTCIPGNVQPCFQGPPGKRGVGGCTDGHQTCELVGEFGHWGDCTGSIGPRAETCDSLDNDCNGCADDELCCGQGILCPAPGDPRIADKAPYTTVTLDGSQFFTGAATSWKWEIQGGPCDQLFATTTSPPAQSFTLSNANAQTATVQFTLSGDYTVTLTVVDASGQTFTCTWVQHISGPGVRFELCWDTSGQSDLDLHVHKPNSTTDFFTAGTSDSTDDCNYRNCKASSFSAVPNWGYANSGIAECVGGPEGTQWQSLGYCRNPRLDIDNISTSGRPENVNIDNPKDAESFRALVHYYGAGLSGSTLVSHPLMNIYCGGHLKATYGQAPNQVQGFSKAGGWAKGDMWRVADVKAIVDASGVTTDCDVTAIHPSGDPNGYFVGHDNSITFNGQ